MQTCVLHAMQISTGPGAWNARTARLTRTYQPTISSQHAFVTRVSARIPKELAYLLHALPASTGICSAVLIALKGRPLREVHSASNNVFAEVVATLQNMSLSM